MSIIFYLLISFFSLVLLPVEIKTTEGGAIQKSAKKTDEGVVGVKKKRVKGKGNKGRKEGIDKCLKLITG